jgi:UDP-galactopyranose mutase
VSPKQFITSLAPQTKKKTIKTHDQKTWKKKTKEMKRNLLKKIQVIDFQ